jgi:catechol 2,3-dioxygenase-like lactoylglutathione lyase family enzyme
MIDHIGFTVGDFDASLAFYTSALAPIGIAPVLTVTPEQSGGGAHAGFGTPGRPFFWIGSEGKAGGGAHVAFAVETRALVDAFHQAAIGAGGQDNGAPGLRPHYHEHYYGAFVLDADGNNIEAVCHWPE